jgi:hypothetical protein
MKAQLNQLLPAAFPNDYEDILESSRLGAFEVHLTDLQDSRKLEQRKDELLFS